MSDELNEYTSNRVEAGQLRQAVVVPSASLFRPDSAGGARDALRDGKAIEVPNGMVMRLLRSWTDSTRGTTSLSVSVNGSNIGWTVIRALY